MDEDLCLDDLEEDVEMPDEFGEGFPEEKLSINVDGLDESKIDALLTAVRKQYSQLEDENSRLAALSTLITEKINAAVQKEIAGNLKTEPRSCPLNLGLTTRDDEEEEEEDDD